VGKTSDAKEGCQQAARVMHGQLLRIQAAALAAGRDRARGLCKKKRNRHSAQGTGEAGYCFRPKETDSVLFSCASPRRFGGEAEPRGAKRHRHPTDPSPGREFGQTSVTARLSPRLADLREARKKTAETAPTPRGVHLFQSASSPCMSGANRRAPPALPGAARTPCSTRDCGRSSSGPRSRPAFGVPDCPARHLGAFPFVIPGRT
jgi:hypothetical protein